MYNLKTQNDQQKEISKSFNSFPHHSKQKPKSLKCQVRLYIVSIPSFLFCYPSDFLPTTTTPPKCHMCFAPATLVSQLFLQNTRHDLAQDLHTNCTLARNVLAPSLCVAQPLTTLAFNCHLLYEVIPEYPIKNCYLKIPCSPSLHYFSPSTLPYFTHLCCSLSVIGLPQLECKLQDGRTLCQFS